MFFDNGGQRCWVVSVGGRGATPGLVPELASLTSGVDAVASEDEPTLIVVPEAVSLPLTEYAALAAAIIAQCARRRDRFAIFDLYDGANPDADVQAARDAFPTTRDLQYAALYYPHVRTTLTYPYSEAGGSSNALVAVGASPPVDVASVATTNPALYNVAVAALADHRVTLPPSSAIAGVYAATDAAHGVWKAPANVQLASVEEPAVALSSRVADGLNVDPVAGKSINTIRAFPGKGTLVWGARTLAGNDNERRYVSVRRLLTMVEQSVARSTRWVVFAPNDATTWAMLRSTIENYLVGKWKQGALLGAKAEEAFFVKCGLGTTMTAQDIADGRLVAEIGIAPIRPAEFVIVRFTHMVQTP
jgi:phage tail sheath protein FI